ncbi:glycosyltransferase [Pandoraea sputorum]|uniref:glycosyltransferase n=1 Tax=Pandoraea sputorum TaxID=93222 RepID=UPI002AF6BE9D|nr:glycosyltransferase [Pandoraea sputorum]
MTSSIAMPSQASTSQPIETWFLTSEFEGQRAGSFRQERWSKVFTGLNCPVRVFNVQGASRVLEKTFDSPEQIEAFREAVMNVSVAKASVREGTVINIIRFIKHTFFIDLYLPNVIALYRRCAQLLRETQGNVVIMASSPPFSMAVVGALLKRRFPQKVTLSVDMRDAWALHDSLGGNRGIKRAIEGAVLRRADAVTTVSYGLAEEFESNYGVKVGTLFNVATHYFEPSAPREIDWRALNPDIDPNRIKAVYTGSTPIGFYDLDSLTRGIRQLRERNPAAADRLQVIFVGACAPVQAAWEALGGGNDVIFVPHVNHHTARAIQQNADVLMFLAYFAPGNKGVVSTKIFEYMALGKPIYPVSLHQNSDVDRLLETYCGRSLCLHTADEMTAAFQRVVEQGANETLPHMDDPQRVRPLLDGYRDLARTLLGKAQGSAS